MEVCELAPGLWRWTALHPDWTPEQAEGGQGWEQEVGCVYAETDDAVVLVDPLVPPEDRERFLHHLDADVERLGRPVEILLTIFWHDRSARELAERYGARVWATPEQPGRPIDVEITRPFAFGDPLPGGIEALDAHRGGEALFWLPTHRALVPGDVLLGDGAGGIRVCPESWLPPDLRGDAFRERLRPLLDLPVERVLLSHGAPVTAGAREALADALSPRGTARTA